MKEVKEIVIENNVAWYEEEIDELINHINELKKQGATHIYFETEEEYGETYTNIKAICKRLETDEEYETRMNIAKHQAEGLRKRELAELQRLKEKYESNEKV